MKFIKNFLFLVCIFLLVPLSLTASSSSKNVGYSIVIEIKDSKIEQLYLLGYYGGESFVFDSAFSSKGKYKFDDPKKDIPVGIYSVVTSKNQHLFDIMVEKSKFFKIVSSEKTPLLYQEIKQSDENVMFFEYQKAFEDNQDLTPFMETSPGSFLSNYVKSKHLFNPNIFVSGSFSIENSNTTEDIDKQILKHYFDQITLQDPRLLRTPLLLDINFYFVSMFDTMISNESEYYDYLNDFLNRTIDTNNRQNSLETQFYYLKKIMQQYLYNSSKYDTLFVYLYDHYYKPDLDQWNIFDESDQRIFKSVAERKRRTLLGHVIEPIAVYDKYKNKLSTQNFNTDYTIIWLWDPDCDHCVEETPVLYDFYQKNHLKYNFEVLAVSITEDYNRWIKYINDNQLNWINGSYAMGDPSYDLVDFFDLLATPGIFIIDKNHKIIARQFPLSKLSEIFENHKNQIQNK
ncbi:MAG TPA: thioredoxin-like domain-containing protein [Bacteroidales bacterium]|nr:thioredoxin-like domain-containing protein [Bacteroidales bacterium]HPS71292.1 thioredoxin-like domain-containing protein [Bacteroidales bacterium]